jgi:GntR family transcriptional regulator, transcriptional repressor for pyruvate dehydrogenase complex
MSDNNMKNIGEISYHPLTDRVMRRIQEAILRGEVLPGEFLPSQHDLAGQFGVGLSTIREAVKGLSLIGLVDAHAGRGTKVLPDALKILNNSVSMKASLGSVEIEQVLEARQVLEGALTRLAAQRATQEDIKDIEAAYQEMRDSTANNENFVGSDMRFHLALARASKNDVLMQTYYLIHSLVEQIVRQADEIPFGVERAMKNHAQILAGIKNHDPDLAEQAAERQFEDMWEYLRSR